MMTSGLKFGIVVKLLVFVFEIDRITARWEIEIWIVGMSRVAKIHSDLSRC